MKGEYEHLNNDGRIAHSRNRKRVNAMRRRKLIILGAAAVLMLGIFVFTIFKIVGKNSDEVEVADNNLQTEKTIDPNSDIKIEVVENAEDVQNSAQEDEQSSEEVTAEEAKADPQTNAVTEKGEAVNVVDIVSASNVGENASITYGIDVSRFQGTIDWAQVAASGINFAMVRVGYRDSQTGEIKADTNAKYNMQEAEKNGIKIGAYFFSTAVNATEANEEATWVANYISKYPITYPVGYNCEGFENSTSRQYNLTKDERSNVAIAFLDAIYKAGYTPIFYASKNELSNNAKWNTSEIEKNFKIWMAWYNQDTSNLASGPAYSGKCAMWQYTNQGTIPGISKKVDVDVAYFGYNGTETAKDTSARETATADVEALMKFTDTNETVTAKSKTNLRDKPSQGADSNVKVTLQNGQTATRTGTSNSGWSRVVYDGVTYYAVSSYLTTDLSVPTPTPEAAPAEPTPEPAVAPATSGFKTKFTDCSELITAKEMVNLRTKPSVTDADSSVVVTLYNGMTATRTGINNEYGWSRIDYNGQTLYCVSSYIKVVE